MRPEALSGIHPDERDFAARMNQRIRDEVKVRCSQCRAHGDYQQAHADCTLCGGTGQIPCDPTRLSGQDWAMACTKLLGRRYLSRNPNFRTDRDPVPVMVGTMIGHFGELKKQAKLDYGEPLVQETPEEAA